MKYITNKALKNNIILEYIKGFISFSNAYINHNTSVIISKHNDTYDIDSTDLLFNILYIKGKYINVALVIALYPINSNIKQNYYSLFNIY